MSWSTHLTRPKWRPKWRPESKPLRPKSTSNRPPACLPNPPAEMTAEMTAEQKHVHGRNGGRKANTLKSLHNCPGRKANLESRKTNLQSRKAIPRTIWKAFWQAMSESTGAPRMHALINERTTCTAKRKPCISSWIVDSQYQLEHWKQSWISLSTAIPGNQKKQMNYQRLFCMSTIISRATCIINDDLVSQPQHFSNLTSAMNPKHWRSTRLWLLNISFNFQFRLDRLCGYTTNIWSQRCMYHRSSCISTICTKTTCMFTDSLVSQPQEIWYETRAMNPKHPKSPRQWLENR